MKKMIWILIIVAVLIVLGFALFKERPELSKTSNVLDGDGMVNPYAISSFTYYRSSGMVNGHYRVTLEADELTVEERIGDKTTRKKYIVPDETINEIEKTLYDSDMKKRFGDFPERENSTLDADTISVVVDYCDGAHIEFDSNQEVPDEVWEAVNETMRLLEAIE